MCGIAGYISNKNLTFYNSLLRMMADVISHRGPDAEGFFENVTHDGLIHVGLAHRRLSIIDLSSGHQPLQNEDGSIQIVFNGEIYNYQDLREQLLEAGHLFRTNSDTETIVHAYEEWGVECVKRFRGMFSFAIWDSRINRLYLARDRYGKKPLFYVENDGVLLFASEIKSLLCFPGFDRHVNQEALIDYFNYRYVPAPLTLFNGIHKLMPGSYAIWELGKLVEHKYFKPDDCDKFAALTKIKDPINNFLKYLDEAVRIRMISDVPFGAFLSGGIDSSAVVALMSKNSSKSVKTFSVGFSESNYSELAYAKTISDLYQTEHHELKISENQIIENLPALVRFRDAPVAEPSDIAIYLLAKEASKTVKMVLTGEGADEFLGGYPKHVFESYVPFYQLIPSVIRDQLIEPIISSLPYKFHRAKTAIATMGIESPDERMPRWFGAMSKDEVRTLIKSDLTTNYKNNTIYSSPNNTSLRRILSFDQTSWLPDNLLERGDRMTMAASIEARMPFMDHKLAEFVSKLPDKFRIRGGQTKWILREAMKQILPAEILNRPKVGFRVPVNEWFRGSMRDYLYDHLTGADSRTAHYYNTKVLNRLLTDHMSAKSNHEKILWSLLVLEIWHKEYNI